MEDFKPFADYLGDGVYASFDGWQITLDLRAQAATQPITTIALEPIVVEALSAFIHRVNRARADYEKRVKAAYPLRATATATTREGEDDGIETAIDS